MRLSDISIRALKPPAKGAEIHYDDTLSGFGVRVSEGGTKSFVLTHGKLRQRETIGRVGILGLHDARSEAKRRLAAYTLGKGSTASISWSDGVAAFLKDKQLKPRTRKDYTRLLSRHFKFGTLKLTEITSLEIDRRVNRLSETPVEQHHAFVVLRTFFRWAHRKHYLDINPMERMATSFRYKPRERILTEKELVKVWKAAGNDTFGTIVKLAILTGQRTGEVKTMTRKMLGEDTATFPDTKNGRAHTWPTGPITRQLLKRISP